MFTIDIAITPEYPFKPPKMRFLTKIWHPNISSVTGAVCLDTLSAAWTPALSIRTALLSLQALMCAPEPLDPQDAEVAKQYIESRALFDATAREWTKKYAKDPALVQEEQIQRLTEMGFSEELARTALEKFEWNEADAISSLLC
eukprot:TRINITY_DN5108_c0_g2_i10.p2 TRINITY_DN5108_c0_g2~~TRINITY_DN5108_c0_g2_i10.p2  ORF type:complete len:144 (+),score=26.85 TRINITY_DN5108_c0_g2_i10:632-1063(+)